MRGDTRQTGSQVKEKKQATTGKRGRSDRGRRRGSEHEVAQHLVERTVHASREERKASEGQGPRSRLNPKPGSRRGHAS